MQTEITKKSVLVLEDDPQWQLIVSQILKKVDTDVTIRCVPTTQAAIQLLALGEKFDLVVADQYLDGVMTGLDLYRHLRALRDQTSFVMLSGLESRQFNDLTIRDAEAPTFVPKSNVFKTFSDVIRDEIGPIEIKEPSTERNENLFLMLVTASAVAFTVSQLSVMTRATHMTPAVPVQTGSMHFNAPKAETLKPHVFVDDALKTQMRRIMNRADEIDRKVGEQ